MTIDAAWLTWKALDEATKTYNNSSLVKRIDEVITEAAKAGLFEARISVKTKQEAIGLVGYFRSKGFMAKYRALIYGTAILKISWYPNYSHAWDRSEYDRTNW